MGYNACISRSQKIRFAYPNVRNDGQFIGCGRFAIFKDNIPTEEGYEVADVGHAIAAKVVDAVSVLAPEALDSNYLIYEKQDQSEEYWGLSLALAYLLAKINCTRLIRLELPDSDIWCTGRIEIPGKEPVLEAVDPAKFKVKLDNFLAADNPDMLFIVPEGNIDQIIRQDLEKHNIKVLSISDFPPTYRLEQKTILKVRRHELEALRDLVFGKSAIERKKTSPLPNPYLGLFAFREEDAPYFFGREEVSQSLYQKVLKNPFVALIGDSGSGKSSVVFAGLVPLLRQEEHWLIAGFRPKTDPVHEFAQAVIPLVYPQLKALEQREESKNLERKLSEQTLSVSDVIEIIVHDVHPGKKFLLIIDQGEEFFPLDDERPLQRAFFEQILQAVHTQEQPPTFTLLITMRVDFMRQAVAYDLFAKMLNTYPPEILRQMGDDELKASIERPAHKVGVTLEQGLTERILQDVGHDAGNLPLLEFTLTQLWDRQTSRQLRHATYDDIGGVTCALAQYANEVYGCFPWEQQEQVRRIFVQLVSPGKGIPEDTSRIATHLEIGEANWEIVTKLADARLVVTGRHENTGEETVELVHETLILHWQQFREWIEAKREFRRWQERLRQTIDEWEQTGRNEQLLLPEIKLSEAEERLNEHPDEIISEHERIYIEESTRVCQQKREERERIRRHQELEEYEPIRRYRARVWGIGKNLILGLLSLGILSLLQVPFSQNAVMDFVMQVFRGGTSQTVRPIPRLVFLEIDEATYQNWGEPLLARDRLLQLIKVTVEGNARVILVDILFSHTTPVDDKENRQVLHSHDQALYDYLHQYSQTCRTNRAAGGTNIRCPQIILLHPVFWTHQSSCPEIRTSFLDNAVNNSPDVHWGTGFVSPDSDQILRSVWLWQPACDEDKQPQVILSMPLLTAAFALQPARFPEDILPDLQASLQDFAPKECSEDADISRSRCVSETTLQESLQVGNGDDTLLLSHPQQHILYRIP
jgi:hypothetical protein